MRAEPVVPRPGPARLGCGRLRQRPELAGRPTPSTHDHALRRHGPYRGWPRPRSPGCRLAWPSGHLVAARTLAAAYRPFLKPGAGWVAYPRCWRSRRTAISSSYLIEQTPTSGWICGSTPTTDARAIPPALPSPAGAVVLARANAALSELVPCDSAARRLEIAQNATGLRQSDADGPFARYRRIRAPSPTTLCIICHVYGERRGHET